MAVLKYNLCALFFGNWTLPYVSRLLSGTYVWNALLHASECWACRKDDFLRLERKKCAVMWWILNFHITDRVSIAEVYKELEIASLVSFLRMNQPRWLEHWQHTDKWINKIQQFKLTGSVGRGRLLKMSLCMI